MRRLRKCGRSSGEWVVQAASTGVSGIIAPDGTWTEHTRLNRQAVLAGSIGLPPGSVFARIGPNPVMYTVDRLMHSYRWFWDRISRCPGVALVRRWNWRAIALLTIAAFVVWFIAGVVLAGREPAPPPPNSQPLTLRGGRVTGNRISTRSWTFDYQNAHMSPDGTIATVDGVRHGVLYKKGKPYLSIAAEHVSLNTQTFDFTATGDVHIEQLNAKTTCTDRSIPIWCSGPM